jgi:hypothetical protein
MYQGTHRTAVILGGSSTVWEDYRKVQSIRAPQDLIHFAVNDIAMHFNKAPVDHICSLHSEMMLALKIMRKVRFHETPVCNGWKSGDGVDVAWWGKLTNNGGTSSLFAVEVALALGVKEVLVCGVTLDSRPHYFEDKELIKGELYDFGMVPESAVWRDKLQGKYVKVAQGAL